MLMIKIVYHWNARNICAKWYDPVRRDKQIGAGFLQYSREKTLMPGPPQQRVNGAERYGNIFDVIASDREIVVSSVAYKYKVMLRMGTDDPPDDLPGEPANTVVRNRFKGTRINGNNHSLPPF
jgi:hypothetical protein